MVEGGDGSHTGDKEVGEWGFIRDEVDSTGEGIWEQWGGGDVSATDQFHGEGGVNAGVIFCLGYWFWMWFFSCSLECRLVGQG